jgi:hypothetical protein
VLAAGACRGIGKTSSPSEHASAPQMEPHVRLNYKLEPPGDQAAPEDSVGELGCGVCGVDGDSDAGDSGAAAACSVPRTPSQTRRSSSSRSTIAATLPPWN